jgi:hypothetical protein
MTYGIRGPLAVRARRPYLPNPGWKRKQQSWHMHSRF